MPVIDIRPPPEFEAGHIEGSVNVPLYRLITGESEYLRPWHSSTEPGCHTALEHG